MISINLKKVVYPYEYMDDWDKFKETLLPDKKAFYSELYLEQITNIDYIHAPKVLEDFKLKNLGEYHDLYLRSVLLADVFENIGKCVQKFMK